MRKPKRKPVEIDRGTPETRRKLPRQDVVGTLAAAGILDEREYSAARDFHDVVDARLRMMLGSSSLQPRIDNSRFAEPADRLGWKEGIMWEKVYLPWEREMGRSIAEPFVDRGKTALIKCPGVTYIELAYAIVVDNFRCRDYERRRGIRNGMATKALKTALNAFADRAESYQKTT